jgi:hypothetical protein
MAGNFRLPGSYHRPLTVLAEQRCRRKAIHSADSAVPKSHPVDTESLVRSENTEFPIIREIMVATTMSSLFVALFALLASSLRTRVPGELLSRQPQLH